MKGFRAVVGTPRILRTQARPYGDAIVRTQAFRWLIVLLRVQSSRQPIAGAVAMSDGIRVRRLGC